MLGCLLHIIKILQVFIKNESCSLMTGTCIDDVDCPNVAGKQQLCDLPDEYKHKKKSGYSEHSKWAEVFGYCSKFGEYYYFLSLRVCNVYCVFAGPLTLDIYGNAHKLGSFPYHTRFKEKCLLHAYIAC